MSFILVFKTCNETSELWTAYKIKKPAATAATNAATPAAMYLGMSYVLTDAIVIGSYIKVTPKYCVLLFYGAPGSVGSLKIVKMGT